MNLLKTQAARWMAFFYASAFLFFASLVYFAWFRTELPTAPMEKGITGLEVGFLEGGIEKYKELKASFKKQVAQSLETNADPHTNQAATNFATYLFPELLPKDNLEKSVGNQLWIPQQQAIEAAPNSPEARKSFEEMRANIWNYENPDRETPTLSTYAEEVLSLYESLSSI